MPPNAWADADVPLIMSKLAFAEFWQDALRQSTYPSWSAAFTATSGTKRESAVGIPATPDCQEGFVKNMLCPPPLDQIPELVPHCATVQLSFQTFSGIYDLADSLVVGSLAVFQYVVGFAM